MARSPRFDFHRPALHTRRTKILATLGPASSTQARIAELIRAGVNVFRLNFSHGTHETHRQTYANIRAAAAECGEHIAILGDLCGPKIRAGHFEHDSIEIVEGQPVVVTVREVMGRDGLIPSEYKHLAKDVKAGDRILIDDGRKELRVERIEDDTEIHCRVVRGGTVSNRKGINLPRVNVSSPALTEKDREDAVLAAELGVDYIALSFVRQASDVEQLVDLLASLGKSIPIISKIEKPEALDHLEAILKVSRGIMVARGDLGVEMPAEEVPMIQRELTRLAIEHNRVVIVATQMLESMIENATATRAEVTDVAWAAMAGADAVMLSGETATGKYPIEAVRTMDRVLRLVEADQYYADQFRHIIAHEGSATDEATTELQLSEGLARATSQLSRELSVRAIIVRSHTGAPAGMISSERPAAPVVAATTSAQTARRLNLLWGIHPEVVDEAELGKPIDLAPRLVKSLGLAEVGQFILLVTGGQSEAEISAPTLKLLLT